MNQIKILNFKVAFVAIIVTFVSVSFAQIETNSDLLINSSDSESELTELAQGPSPVIIFGKIRSGDKTIELDYLTTLKELSVVTNETMIPIDCKVVRGTLSVDGVDQKGHVGENGLLDEGALAILKEAKGKQVTIMVVYLDDADNENRTALVFNVKE